MAGLVDFLDALDAPNVHFTSHDGVMFLVFAYCREFGFPSGDSTAVDSQAMLRFLSGVLRQPEGRLERWEQQYAAVKARTNDFTDLSTLGQELRAIDQGTVPAAAPVEVPQPPQPEPAPAPVPEREFWVHNNDHTGRMTTSELQAFVDAGGVDCPVQAVDDNQWHNAAHYGINRTRPRIPNRESPVAQPPPTAVPPTATAPRNTPTKSQGLF